MLITMNRRNALLSGGAALAAIAVPAIPAASSPDAELATLGADFDRLDAAIAEVNSLLEPTDAEAERLRDEKPAAMKFTGRDHLWFGKVNGPDNDYWSAACIDQLKPYVPRGRWDNAAPKNLRIAELKRARDAWAYRNLEFALSTGRRDLLCRLEQLYPAIDRVEIRINELTAGSVAGLVVKAKVVRRENWRLWERPKEDLDPEDEYVRGLVDNLLALAGGLT